MQVGEEDFMEALKQVFKPVHLANFSHLKGINWANGAAILIMVTYLLAIIFSEEIQGIVQTIDMLSN